MTVAAQISALTAVPFSQASAFINPLTTHSGVTELTNSISSGIASAPGELATKLSELKVAHTTMTTGIAAGVAQKLASLKTDIPIIQATHKTKKAIGKIDNTEETSLCDIFDSTMGSIKNLQKFVDGIIGEVGNILGKIEALIALPINMALAAIEKSIAFINAKLLEFQNMILAEIELIKKYAELLVGVAFLSLFDAIDPCLKDALSSMMK